MFDSLRTKISEFISSVREQNPHSISAATKVKAAISGKANLSKSEVDELMWNLHTELLQSDVSVETSDYLAKELGKRLSELEIGTSTSSHDIKDAIRQVLSDALTPEKELDLIDEIMRGPRPYKILLLGVNGTGKTTTMAKIAYLLKQSGLSVVFAAGDTFRAGAIEQLTQHADKLGVKVVTHQRGADSAAVIYDAVEHAKAKNIDVVLADTAGRMQSKANLMEELKKIMRVNQPNLTLFIGDALAGNDAVEQAKTFNEVVGFDAAVLSKMDADAKGGAALSISYATRKPIIYVGVGQKYEDLRRFDKEWFIDAIVGK